MSFCTSICEMILELLKPLSKDIKFVLSHESIIKDTPVKETIAAVGVKKCTISARSTSIDDNVKVDTNNRKAAVTVGINLYVPYKLGTAGCVSAFEDIFDTLVLSNASGLCESRLLSTAYSRDTQCLVAKTEFVFETFLGVVLPSGPESPDVLA